MTRHENHDDDLHDRGLAFDLQTLMQRRRALRIFAGAGAGAVAIAVVGCGSEDDKTGTSSATATSTTKSAGSDEAVASAATATGTSAATGTTAVSPIPATATPASACTDAVPEETGEPYPGDGSNGPNVLTQSGIVRSDIRSSFGSSQTVAQGVPLTVAMTIVDTNNGCKPLSGAAVYIWHCDREGRYSLYSQGATNENYLRGVQAADANGLVKFTTIFPAAYSGRWPHIHFEVYPSLDAASSSKNASVTSQLAMPEAICNAVFATSGYEQSVKNMAQTPITRDMVFSDGYSLQMPAVTGNASSGYAATITVGV